jgi:hypothetical protein
MALLDRLAVVVALVGTLGNVRDLPRSSVPPGVRSD